jgi:hypothetical protein
MFKVTITTTTGLQNEQLFANFSNALTYARKQYNTALVYSVFIRRAA